MYDTILIPTDGSEEAEAAAKHGIGLAEQLGASVHALYVVESRVTGLPSDSMRQAEEVEELTKYGEEITGRIAEMAEEAGVECTQDVRKGKVYETIVEYADEEGLDAIAMGTRGRSGIEEFLLGNVTEKVVRTANVPVLTVRRPKLR